MWDRLRRFWPPKAKAITAATVIEKMVLPLHRQRFNLQLRVHSRINRVTNPGKSGSNHLLSSHWRRFISLLRKPDGMSINARRQPRSVQLPGVFLLGRRFFMAVNVLWLTVFFK
jgi:hypothetical protein